MEWTNSGRIWEKKIRRLFKMSGLINIVGNQTSQFAFCYSCGVLYYTPEPVHPYTVSRTFGRRKYFSAVFDALFAFNFFFPQQQQRENFQFDFIAFWMAKKKCIEKVKTEEHHRHTTIVVAFYHKIVFVPFMKWFSAVSQIWQASNENNHTM